MFSVRNMCAAMCGVASILLVSRRGNATLCQIEPEPSDVYRAERRHEALQCTHCRLACPADERSRRNTRPPKSIARRRASSENIKTPYETYMVQSMYIRTKTYFSRRPSFVFRLGVFSRALGRGAARSTNRTSGYTTAKARAAAKVRSACSGCSQPRTLAYNKIGDVPTGRKMTPPRGSCKTCQKKIRRSPAPGMLYFRSAVLR